MLINLLDLLLIFSVTVSSVSSSSISNPVPRPFSPRHLPYILSFVSDHHSKKNKDYFVRREASNRFGVDHFQLKGLSRAEFVHSKDITNHRPFEKVKDVVMFYDEEKNYKKLDDHELAFGPKEIRVIEDNDDYDPDFYDAVAAQMFESSTRTAKSTVALATILPHINPNTVTSTTTTPTSTTTVPSTTTIEPTTTTPAPTTTVPSSTSPHSMPATVSPIRTNTIPRPTYPALPITLPPNAVFQTPYWNPFPRHSMYDQQSFNNRPYTETYPAYPLYDSNYYNRNSFAPNQYIPINRYFNPYPARQTVMPFFNIRTTPRPSSVTRTRTNTLPATVIDATTPTTISITLAPSTTTVSPIVSEDSYIDLNRIEEPVDVPPLVLLKPILPRARAANTLVNYENEKSATVSSPHLTTNTEASPNPQSATVSDAISPNLPSDTSITSFITYDKNSKSVSTVSPTLIPLLSHSTVSSTVSKSDPTVYPSLDSSSTVSSGTVTGYSSRRYCRDIFFMLDASESNKNGFDGIKSIIGNLADLALKDSMRRVGLISFSSHRRQRIVFDVSEPRDNTTSEVFHTRLDDLSFSGGITELGSALSLVRDLLANESSFDHRRYSPHPWPLDIVLFTDGYSFDDPTHSSRFLLQSGHRIYVVGLFTNILRSELDSVTGDPSRVYSTLDEVEDLANRLASCL